MNAFRRIAVAWSLAIGCCWTVTAQQQSAASIPKVLQITREYTKPGRNGAVHQKAESAFVAAMARAKWPTHYMAATSLTGKPRALFLIRYESFEAWEKDNQAEMANTSLAASIDQAAMKDGDLLDSMDQAVFYFRENLSLRPMVDISKTRYLDITVIKIKTGKYRQFEELTKLVKEGIGKGDPDAHWGAFELAYGGETGTYLILTARKSLSEVDHSYAIENKVNAAIGEENGKKMDQLASECIEYFQSQLFAFDPSMSYPDEAWVKSDPDFWKPAPKMAAKATGKPAADEKPKQ